MQFLRTEAKSLKSRSWDSLDPVRRRCASVTSVSSDLELLAAPLDGDFGMSIYLYAEGRCLIILI